MLGLALVLSFGISFSSVAADKSKVDELIGLMKSGKINLWSNSGNTKVMHIYENTGLHDNFETTFKRHFAILEGYSEDEECITLVIRDYQDYYTIHDAQGFILYILVDLDKDGVVDRWRKDNRIVLDNTYFLDPRYPPGLINYDWFNLSREEAQKLYDKELKYMLENADKANAYKE